MCWCERKWVGRSLGWSTRVHLTRAKPCTNFALLDRSLLVPLTWCGSLYRCWRDLLHLGYRPSLSILRSRNVPPDCLICYQYYPFRVEVLTAVSVRIIVFYMTQNVDRLPPALPEDGAAYCSEMRYLSIFFFFLENWCIHLQDWKSNFLFQRWGHWFISEILYLQKFWKKFLLPSSGLKKMEW